MAAILGSVLCAAAAALLALTTVSSLGAEGRFGAAIGATLALCLLALSIRKARGADGEDRIAWAAGPILLVLSPVWLFHSVVFVVRSEFGALSPYTLLAAAAAYGLPTLIALRWSLLPWDQLRERGWDAALAAVSSLFVLGSLEAGLRVYYGLGHPESVWRRTVGNEEIVRSSDPRKPYRLAPHATWGHQYSSNDRKTFGPDNTVRYTLNGEGFRDDEFDREKPPGTIRVALLGDSFAFGEGVAREHTAAYLMQGLLTKAAGCPVELDNFAVPGYDTLQEEELLEDTVLSYHPDVVVVWYFLNDVELRGTMAYLGWNPHALLFPQIRRFSALARFVGGLLDAQVRERNLIMRYKAEYAREGGGWTRALGGLRKIAVLLRQHGITGALFVHPVLYHLDDRYPFREVHAQVVGAAESLGFHAFDLMEAFRGRDGPRLWVHPSDQHPNDEAQRIAAEYAAAHLAPLLPACREVKTLAGRGAPPGSPGESKSSRLSRLPAGPGEPVRTREGARTGSD